MLKPMSLEEIGAIPKEERIDYVIQTLRALIASDINLETALGPLILLLELKN